MNKRNVLCNIIISIGMGAVIYYFFSPEVIFVKVIDNLLGVSFRFTDMIYKTTFWQLIRYYFLDMLWGYALVFALFYVWGNNTAKLSKILCIACFFSIAMEVLQITPLARGTFDVCDIGLEVLAEVVAVFIIKYHTWRNIG